MTKTPTKYEEQKIDEADLAMDYFRCAARINPMSAVANYKQFEQLTNPFDERSLFIAQQGLLHSSYEDLAQFLHALNRRKENGTTLQWTLSSDEDCLSNFPGIVSKFKEPADILEWLGIDKKHLIKKIRQHSGQSQRKCTQEIDSGLMDIIQGIKICKGQKIQRQVAYNVTKHGKPILSVKPVLLRNIADATEEDGPHFFYQKKKVSGTELKLRSKSVSFSDKQFYAMTRSIIQISEKIRDLLYFFIIDHYPDRFTVIKESYENQIDFRKEAKNIFD